MFCVENVAVVFAMLPFAEGNFSDPFSALLTSSCEGGERDYALELSISIPATFTF